jgi:hypothetical protein
MKENAPFFWGNTPFTREKVSFLGKNTPSWDKKPEQKKIKGRFDLKYEIPTELGGSSGPALSAVTP